jgi:hypothetical protein
VDGHDAERVADLVRDPGGHLADEGQPLGPEQPRPQRLLVGDVAQELEQDRLAVGRRFVARRAGEEPAVKICDRPKFPETERSDFRNPHGGSQ